MNRRFSLKNNLEIQKIIKAKKSVGNKYYALYYQRAVDFKVAISPSKRFKTAVERNYEKRVAKEIIRPHISELSALKLLLVIKPTVKDLSFAQKQEQILYLLKKIIKEKT
ncbi:MAG: ribonuclease P protein component [Bacilli bacterium]|nr:ribonuclease P protein component [Bacilli bacterium]